MFQCFHFSFLYITFLSKKKTHYFLFLKKIDYLYKNICCIFTSCFRLFLFLFFYFMLFYFIIVFFNAFLCSLFPRKFLKFKGWPWIWGILTFFHDYFSKKCWNSMFFFLILMGFAFSTMIFRQEKNIFLFKCVAYICNVFQIDGINSFWRRSNHWKVAPTAGLF